MKFKTSAKLFGSALAKVSPVSRGGIKLALLGNVLTVTATDAHAPATVQCSLEVISEESGAVALRLAPLFEFVRSLEVDEIAFQASESGKVTLKTSRGSFKLEGSNGDSYPIPRFEAMPYRVSIEPMDFAKMIDTVAFTVLENHPKPIAQGVLFHAKDNVLRVVGTDGHRLSVVKYSKIKFDDLSGIVIPIKVIKLVAGLCRPNISLEVMFGDGSACFVIGDVTVYVKAIVGTYPNYELVIPANLKFWVKALSVNEVSAMLRRVLVLADDHTQRVQVVVSEKELEVHAENYENSARDAVGIVEAGELVLFCNGKYLQEIVDHLDELFDVGFKDANSSIMLVPHIQHKHMNVEMVLALVKDN